MYLIDRENGEFTVLDRRECYYVKDIVKYFLKKNFTSNQSFSGYELVYDNIILNAKKPLQFYKISSQKKIYMGSIEGFISRNEDLDLIVEVVVQCFVSESIFIFMKQCDQISKVKEIVSGLIEGCEFVSILNVNGEELVDSMTISHILKKDSKEKIFISWTPNYLHEGYNRYLIEKYFWYGGNSPEGWINYFDKILGSIRNDLQIFKEHLVSNASKSLIPDTKLSKDLFKRSKLYFCKWYSERLYEECEQEWKSKINKNCDFSKVYYFIRIAMFFVLHEKYNWTPHSYDPSFTGYPFDTIKSNLIKALDILLQNNQRGAFFMKKFIKYVCMGEISTENMENEMEHLFIKDGAVKIKMVKSVEYINIPIREISLFKLKKIVQIACGIKQKLLYFVNYDEQDLKNRIKISENTIIHLEEMTRLHKDQKIREIAEGSYGTVYSFKEVDSDEKFAIKCFKDPIESTREININKEIKFDNYNSKFLGLMRYEGKICIAFKLFRESLDDKIKAAIKNPHSPMSVIGEKTIVKVTYNILTELKVLHKLGIIHRDIKPENILMDNSGKATLCDFGCSKLICNQTNDIIINKMTQYITGTVDYMAPETFKNVPYSEKSDIWSLGIVIIKMIFGKLSDYIKKVKIESLRHHSKELRELLDKCRKLDPGERSSANELLELEVFKDI